MNPELDRIYEGDVLAVLRGWPDAFINCAVTSPPYWGLRDYKMPGQIGLESTPEAYTAKMVEVFREVRRVLRDDGTLWLNLGDSHAGSWGAQGRQGESGQVARRSACVERQVAAAQKRKSGTGRGSRCPGLKNKDLVGIPWRVAFALQADGWYLRSDIIWAKKSCMPESVTDRPTRAHEYIFLLAKSERYYYDHIAIREPLKDSSVARLAQDIDSQAGSLRVPGKTNGTMKAVRFGGNKGGGEHGSAARRSSGRAWEPGESVGANKRTVWSVATQPFKESHFATFPPKLIEPCILAGSPRGGVVLDPFMGAGTTALVSAKHGRHFLGVELNPEYAAMARKRVAPELAQGKFL